MMASSTESRGEWGSSLKWVGLVRSSKKLEHHTLLAVQFVIIHEAGQGNYTTTLHHRTWLLRLTIAIQSQHRYFIQQPVSSSNRQIGQLAPISKQQRRRR